MNSLADELANVSVKEHALLSQCRDLLSTVAAIQVLVVNSFQFKNQTIDRK